MNEDGEVGAYMIQDALCEVRDFMIYDEWTVSSLLEFFARNFTPDANLAAQEYVFNQMAKGVDFGNADFRSKMNRDIWRYFSGKLSTMDQFTQTGAMGFGARKAGTEIEFTDLSPQFFIRGMHEPGSFGTISGKTREKKKEGSRMLGVGKTATALVIAKMYADASYAVATNIPMKGKYPGIIQVHSLKELITICLQNMRNGKATLAILDEFSQYISKEVANKKEWVDLKKLLYLFRKFGILLMVITQREVEIPNAIMEMGVVHIQKVTQVKMNFRRGNNHFRIGKVPDSPIPFETMTPGMFRVDDLLVEPFYDSIFNAEKEGRPILDAALTWLNDPRAISKSERMACVKVAVVHGHLTYKEAGGIAGVSDFTVHDWLTKMGVINKEAEC
jgi:hypothetical protein